MLRLLSDENFNGDIVRGLFLRQPNLDLLRVQDVGLREVDEKSDFRLGSKQSHDRATMPDFAYKRLIRGE